MNSLIPHYYSPPHTNTYAHSAKVIRSATSSRLNPLASYARMLSSLSSSSVGIARLLAIAFQPVKARARPGERFLSLSRDDIGKPDESLLTSPPPPLPTTNTLLSQGSGQLVKMHAIDVLLQSRMLLHMIKDDDDYTRKLPHFFNQSIGSHFRHGLSHYDRVCSAGPVSTKHIYADSDSMLKYDERERNTPVELHKHKADESIQRLISHINRMHICYSTHVTAQFVTIVKDQPTPHSNGETESPSSSSSSDVTAPEAQIQSSTYEIKSNLMRELSFVAHHLTHHIAMMTLMMDSLGYDSDTFKTLGMAPATILVQKLEDNQHQDQHQAHQHHAHHVNKSDSHHPEIYKDSYRDKVTGKHVFRRTK